MGRFPQNFLLAVTDSQFHYHHVIINGSKVLVCKSRLRMGLWIVFMLFEGEKNI